MGAANRIATIETIEPAAMDRFALRLAKRATRGESLSQHDGELLEHSKGGCLMVRNSAGILLALSIPLSGCASSHGAKIVADRFVRPPVMTFVVGSTDGGMLKDVEVLLVDNRGDVRLLGMTEVLGRFSVLKETLARGEFVVFCKPEQYFCGALRMLGPASEAPGFLDYDEHFIQLAPLALR